MIKQNNLPTFHTYSIYILRTKLSSPHIITFLKSHRKDKDLLKGRKLRIDFSFTTLLCRRYMARRLALLTESMLRTFGGTLEAWAEIPIMYGVVARKARGKLVVKEHICSVKGTG